MCCPRVQQAVLVSLRYVGNGPACCASYVGTMMLHTDWGLTDFPDWGQNIGSGWHWSPASKPWTGRGSDTWGMQPCVLPGAIPHSVGELAPTICQHVCLYPCCIVSRTPPVGPEWVGKHEWMSHLLVAECGRRCWESYDWSCVHILRRSSWWFRTAPHHSFPHQRTTKGGLFASSTG